MGHRSRLRSVRPFTRPSDTSTFGATHIVALAVLAAGAACEPRVVEYPPELPRPAVRPLPPGAATYAAAPQERKHPVDADGALVEAAARRRLGPEGARLVADARLDELAAWADCRYGETKALPAAIVTLAAQRLGLVEPSVVVACLSSPRRAEELDRVLQNGIVDMPENVPFTHIGVATRPVPGGFVGALALSSREIEGPTLPRSVQPGAKVVVEGRVGERFERARLYVTLPSGKTRTEESPARFRFALELSEAGQYGVEVMGDGAPGPVVLLNVPLRVGTREPEQIDERTGHYAESGASPPREHDEASTPEEVLLRLLNTERARASLPPVTLDEELGRVARAHTEDMQAHNFMGHVSPSTGTVEDRVKAAAVDVARVGEVVGFAASVRDVHAGFMASPGHRSGILTPEFTHVGIGVARRPSLAGGHAFYVTEVLGRRVPPIDVATAPASIRRALDERRRSNGLPALVHDAALEKAAAAAAAAGTAAGVEDSRAAALVAARAPMGQALAKKPRGRRGCVWTAQTRELEQALAVDAVDDAAAERVGVAVAQSASDPKALVVIAIAGVPGKAVRCGGPSGE